MKPDVLLQAGLVMASFSMHLFVALSAQGDQILFLVATGPATQFEVMHLQVLHAPANLASPAVALQHPPMQVSITWRVESQSRVLGWDFLHEAPAATSDRKTFCCSPGRNL